MEFYLLGVNGHFLFWTLGEGVSLSTFFITVDKWDTQKRAKLIQIEKIVQLIYIVFFFYTLP